MLWKDKGATGHLVLGIRGGSQKSFHFRDCKIVGQVKIGRDALQEKGRIYTKGSNMCKDG